MQGAYTIANGRTTALKGTVTNANLIALNSTGLGAYLNIEGTVNLQGQGKVTLGSGDYNSIRHNGAPATDTLNNFHTIEGKGTIAVEINTQPGAVINANAFGGSLLVAGTLVNSPSLTVSLRSCRRGTLCLQVRDGKTYLRVSPSIDQVPQ